MTKEKLYTYLGTNGTVTTPVHIPDIQAMIQYRLIADNGKVLVNGDRREQMVTILESELDKWSEVKA